MAANLAAMHGAFARIGFTQQGAVALVDDQGLGTLEAVAKLDDAMVSNLCQMVRCPGGQVAVRNAMVPNPGTPVSQMAELNMHSLALWVRHRDRISCPHVPADVTVPIINALADLQKREKNWSKPTDKPKINHQDWFQMLELIQEYFAQSPGVTCIPLAYVLREEINVLDHAEDPADNYPSP